MNKVIIAVVIIVVLSAIFFTFKKDQSNNSSDTSNPTMTPSQTAQPTPELAIDAKKSYSAVMKTSEGDITIAFTGSKTPVTVNNFVALAKKKFYDGTIFHRVINGFMIQGGDPEGTGRGGPGYRFDDEKFEGDYTAGTVAMANAGPNTNGSQFFIMHKDNTDLPKNYVIFGHVTKGMEVVNAIATAPVKPEGEGSSPVTPVKIESIEIIEK